MIVTPISEDGYWCIYRLTQSYGGREEGGWWWDCGELLEVRRATLTYFLDKQGFICDENGEPWYREPDADTLAWADRQAEKHGLELDANRRTRSYVPPGTPEDGSLQWRSESDGIPTHYPKQVPRYE